MVETALLMPILVTLFLAVMQLISYLQAATATQYAAFAAARAYQVYGKKTLGEMNYRRIREAPYTNRLQTIAEAAAEKVIFESLLWEHQNVVVGRGEQLPLPTETLDRYYRDGVDTLHDGRGTDATEGAVRVNFQALQGVEVTYCMPVIVPALDSLFRLVKKTYGCKKTRSGRRYEGIAIRKVANFGREPTEL